MLFLVTGCSTGIGLHLSQAILTAGHRCIASSRNPSKTPDIVSDFEKKGGIWIQLDVASPAAGDVIRKVIADHGPIDVLINNAGISDVGPLENHSLQAAQGLFETNLWGPLRLTQAIIPSMRERRSGTIVNISSSVVFQPHPLLSMYAASKGALESMTDALHAELGVFGVRTLLVEPGLTRSEFSNTAKQDMGELITRLEVFKGTPIEQAVSMMTNFYGNEPNDPAKAAQAIIREVLSPSAQPPLSRLIVGQDAVQQARGRVEHLTAIVKASESINVGFES